MSRTGTLDWVFNQNPLFKWVDGHKTEIAGALVAVSLGVDGIAAVLPPGKTSLILVVVSGVLKKAAGVIGAIGVAGKMAKASRKDTTFGEAKA